MQGVKINQRVVGVPLISKRKQCQSCGGKLLVKGDRPSSLLSLYTDTVGTVPATHYRKVCSNSYRKGCRTVQHYGDHTLENGTLRYDDDWETLPYFVSSRQTAFQLSMLRRLDAEILLGQLSYKQSADIYNYIHGYTQHGGDNHEQDGDCLDDDDNESQW